MAGASHAAAYRRIGPDGVRRPDRLATAALCLSVIIVLGVLLRLAVYAVLPDQPASDYVAYLTIAENIHDGEGIQEGYNKAFLSPGYPMLMGAMFMLTGKSLFAAHMLNIVLAALTLLMVAFIGSRVFGSPLAGLAGALIWACYLESIIYSDLLARENLALPLFAIIIIVALLIQEGRAILPAAAVGGAAAAAIALSGASGLAIVPVMWLALAIAPGSRGRRIAGFLLMTGIMTALLVPWLYRNFLIFGHPVLNTNGGFNLWIGNNPNATGHFISITDTPLGPGWQDRRMSEGEYATDRLCGEMARQWILANPVTAFWLALRKLWLFWTLPPFATDPGTPVGLLEGLMRRITLAQYVGIVALAVYATVAAAWRRNWLVVPLVLAVLLYMGIHGIYYVMPRYRLPATLLLAILAGGAVQMLLARYWPSLARRLPE